METKTATVYLYCVVYAGDAEPYWSTTTTDMSDCDGYTLVETKEVEFTIPDFNNVREDVIHSLEKTRDKLRAEANVKITKVDNTIASFLALEHIHEA